MPPLPHGNEYLCCIFFSSNCLTGRSLKRIKRDNRFFGDSRSTTPILKVGLRFRPPSSSAGRDVVDDPSSSSQLKKSPLNHIKYKIPNRQSRCCLLCAWRILPCISYSRTHRSFALHSHKKVYQQ